MLLWVDKHDDAYAWARRKACQVNRVSGALQIVDVEAAEQSVGDAISAAVEQALAEMPQAKPALFSSISDDDLTRVGVPPALLPSVRALRHEDDLARLLEWLPPECVDAFAHTAAVACLGEASYQQPLSDCYRHARENPLWAPLERILDEKLQAIGNAGNEKAPDRFLRDYILLITILLTACTTSQRHRPGDPYISYNLG